MTPSRDDSGPTRHVFTVDVEEYFQVHAFEDLVQRGEWEAFPSRVDRNTASLLGLLDELEIRATFFVLGWVAERNPDVVRRIAEAGHEVASHSMWHRRISEMDPEEFREDARTSKALLEEITGEPVLGYRAPSFSLSEDTRWMLDVLAQEGYRYDSSLCPARRIGGGGVPGAQRRPHVVGTSAGPILELPLTTLSVGGFPVPAAGGAYFRHFPYALAKAGLEESEADGEPGVFYFHPWELDPDQPRIPASPITRLRHYRNVDKTPELLERLAGDFDFTSARELFRLDADDSGQIDADTVRPGGNEGRSASDGEPERESDHRSRARPPRSPRARSS